MKENKIKNYDLFFKDYPDVLNIEQLGKILGGIGKKTLYKLLKNGTIKSFKIGREYRIPKLFVLEYLKLIDEK